MSTLMPPIPPPPPPVDEPTPPAATPSPRQSRVGLWSLVAVAVICLGGLLWIVSVKLPGWMRSAGTGQPSSESAGQATDSRKIHATLFYVSADGSELVPISREVAVRRDAGRAGAAHRRSADAARTGRPPLAHSRRHDGARVLPGGQGRGVSGPQS